MVKHRVQTLTIIFMIFLYLFPINGIAQIEKNEFEPNAEMNDALELQSNVTIFGELIDSMDIDWFYINITTSQDYLLTIISTQEIQTVVYFANASIFQFPTESYFSSFLGYYYTFVLTLEIDSYFIEIQGSQQSEYELKYLPLVEDNYEQNDARDSSHQLEFNSTKKAMLIFDEDRLELDWWSFNITTSMRISIKIYTNITSIHMQLNDENTFTTSSGRKVDNEMWRGYEISKLLLPGTYFIGLELRSKDSGPYSIIVHPLKEDHNEYNDQANNATQIEGNVIEANFHNSTDIDWYQVNLIHEKAGLNLHVTSLDTEESSSSIIKMKIYSTTLEVLIQDNIIADKSNVMYGLEIASGTYYISLEQVTDLLAYSLNLALIPADLYESDNTMEAATQLIPNESQIHNLHHINDEDWYWIELEVDSNVEVVLSEPSEIQNLIGQPTITLYSESGSYLTNVRGEPFPIMTRILEAGSYFIVIRALSALEPVQNYKITFDESIYIPPESDSTTTTESRKRIGFTFVYSLSLMIMSFTFLRMIKRKVQSFGN